MLLGDGGGGRLWLGLQTRPLWGGACRPGGDGQISQGMVGGHLKRRSAHGTGPNGQRATGPSVWVPGAARGGCRRFPSHDGGARGRGGRAREDASTRQKPEMLFYLHHESNKLSDEVQNTGLRVEWSRQSEEGTRPSVKTRPHGTERE